MQKKNYAVIGHPIAHTMSPFIHKHLFELTGINACYSVFDIHPDRLKEEFDSTLSKLDGFNITIPHKQAIIPFINELDQKAKLYGSVNTFFNDNGVYRGYTTDPDGFLQALKSADIDFCGNTVILGCGGVARTMAYEAVLAGNPLTFAVRKEDINIAQSIKDELQNLKECSVNVCLLSELSDKTNTIDLLVNATPLGMFPKIEICPTDDAVIKKSKAVFDAVYNPLETVLVQKAKANGAKAVGGMSMLVWQAAVAQTKWNRVSFNKEDIENLCKKCMEELKKR